MYRCYNPLYLPVEGSDILTHPVPCGHCYNCQMKSRAEWDLRLWIESQYAKTTAFVTYTYEDRWLHKAHDYSEFQKLHKRMRNDGIVHTYYHISEFGEKRGRPHNHELIFMDVDIDPLELYRYRKYGIMDIGTVEPASIHYVTKWHVHPKYRTGESKEKHGFQHQSQGLGAQILENWSVEDFRPTYKLPDGRILPVSRYYRKKLGVTPPDDWRWTTDYKRWSMKFPYADLGDYLNYKQEQFTFLLDKQLQQRYEKLE